MDAQATEQWEDLLHPPSERGLESVSRFEDDVSDGKNGTTQAAEQTSRKETEQELKSSLGTNEAKLVMSLRVSVFLVLLVTGSVVSLLVKRLISDEEIQAFQGSFESNSKRLVDAFHLAVARKLVAIDGLATSITGHALDEGLQFPNVTLPDFSVKAANARIAADSGLIYWVPIVSDEDRSGWESYSSQMQGHLMQQLMEEESFRGEEDKRLGYFPGDRRKLQTSDEFTPFINFFNPESGAIEPSPGGSGPYGVFWQTSPALPIVSLMNYDLASNLLVRGSFFAMLKSKKAVLEIATDLAGGEGTNSDIVITLAIQLGQYRHQLDQYLNNPSSAMVYPVFDSFSQEKQVAGFLLVNLFWSVYFKDVLPEDSLGYIVVLENSHNQTFSYQVDGPHVQYVGQGDSHSSKFDDMKVEADVSKYIRENADGTTQSFTSADLDDQYIQYSLRVYPSQATEDKYISNHSVKFAGTVAGVFAFAAVIFVMYDVLISRRQRIVMQRAIASGEIVTSLFPKQVRTQVYNEKTRAENVTEKNVDFLRTTLSPISTQLAQDRPIADLYQNTTVMFADLKGFTAWSSDRAPADVFELLETIYGEFDKIARKMDVFKVETIGDCYVAVTGIPSPQADHAARMVRFAHVCMVKMSKLTEKLVHSLGEETRELEFRVGLHSGPTTAGVLRGDKGRFQLFGDTVNTAARMESTGAPGQIHFSLATAAELRSGGHDEWVIEREDLISVKGKGEMQTYFATFTGSKSSNTRGSSGPEHSCSSSQ